MQMVFLLFISISLAVQALAGLPSDQTARKASVAPVSAPLSPARSRSLPRSAALSGVGLLASGPKGLWLLSRDKYELTLITKEPQGVKKIAYPWPVRDRAQVSEMKTNSEGHLCLYAPSKRAIAVLRDTGEVIMHQTLSWEVWSVAPVKGGVVVNIPNGGQQPFAYIPYDGGPVKKFGSIEAAALPCLREMGNTFFLIPANDGGFLAAGTYSPVLRRFSADLREIWSRTLSDELINVLDKQNKQNFGGALAGLTGSCGGQIVTVYAVAGSADGTDGFYVNYSSNLIIHHLDKDGNLRQVIPVNLPKEAGHLPRTWGIWNGRLVVVFKSGVIELERETAEAFFSGRVLDNSEKGIAGARGAAILPGGYEISADSDRMGRITFEGLHSEVVIYVKVSADGYVTKNFGPFTLPVKNARLRMDAARMAKGRVVNQTSGEPVKRFQIDLLVRQVSENSRREVQVVRRSVEDREGKFAISVPVAGPFVLAFRSPRFTRREETYGAGDPEERIISLEEGRRIEGHVISKEDGDPVAEATVSLFRAQPGVPHKTARESLESSKTDESGNFIFEDLASGEYQIEVDHAEYMFERKVVKLASGHEELEIALRRGPSADFLIMAERLGDPIEGALVQLVQAGRAMDRALLAKSDGSGHALLKNIPAGLYSAYVNAHGYRQHLETVVVGENSAENSHKILMSKGFVLSGRVYGLEAYGVGQVRLDVSDKSGLSVTAPVAADGSYTADGMTAGSILVEVYANNNLLYWKSIDVPEPPSGAANADIELPPPVTLHGIVHTGSQRCAGCKVTLEGVAAPGSQPVQSFIADAQGQYRGAIVFRGTYLGQASSYIGGDQRVSAKRIVEVPDDVKEIEADWEVAAGTILGVAVSAQNGSPVAGAEIRLARVTNDVVYTLSRTLSDESGRFHLMYSSDGNQVIGSHPREGTALAMLVPGAAPPGDLQLSFSKSSLLRINAINPAGLPVNWVKASVVYSSGVEYFSRLEANAEGLIEVPIPGDEPVTIRLATQELAIKIIRNVTANSGVIIVQFGLPATYYIRIRGATASESYRVRLLDASGQVVYLETSHRDGSVVLLGGEGFLGGIEFGRYQLSVLGPEGKVSTYSLPEITTTEIVKVEIGLLPH